ncbi:cell division protein FtsL [Salsuginibacillus halophilus]|uniref:Cell division protein FtsL n=1 Tax=Salsuginibacillus halophilus TaxID=517424 RepID=A0A2P8HX35_9BACI|nr:cell division protein FtsL [Salsuginibacillus halophilus]PSL50777.1 cell division protein FtsL [Salsuginibacillus halophilus]
MANAYQYEPKRKLQPVHKKITQRVPGGITKGEKLLLVIFVAVTALLAALIIANYAEMHAVDREVTSLEQSVYQQQEANESLQLQVSELSAPDRIVDYATNELGMSLNNENVEVVQHD